MLQMTFMQERKRERKKGQADPGDHVYAFKETNSTALNLI